MKNKLLSKSLLGMCALFCMGLATASAQQYKLASPNGKLTVTVNATQDLNWQIEHNGTSVLQPSAIALEGQNEKGKTVARFGKDIKVTSEKRRSVDTSFPTPFYKKAEVKDVYNELVLKCRGGYSVEFRAYNDGAAYRLVSEIRKPYQVTGETAEFNFDKDYQALVIDEAHNWKGLKKGAPDYGKFIQRHVQRTLLVTATPVHMSVNDLKNIIDLGHCNKTTSKRARSFDQFIRSYNALFAKDKDKDKHLLTAAKQLQEKVAKCWTKLAGNKEALDLIKASQVRLDRQPIAGNMRAAQLKEWDSLSKLSNKPSVQSLRELADAVLELRQFQDDQLLKYLRLLIVKRRAEKHITRDNGHIGTRRYLCGHECSTEALSDHQDPPADDVHLLFHDTSGIEQGGNSWVNLIGMRLSQLPLNESDQKQNARLMVGLPSSYAALTQSALLKDVQYKKNHKPVDKRPEVTRLYAGVFSRCTTNMDATHPKVKRTVDIVLANLLNGRKTLVFCQRLATVNVLAEQINRRVTDYLKAQFRDLPSINTEDSPLDMLDRAIACAQRNASIFDVTGKPISPNSFDAFKKYMHSSSSEKSISANHYDARLVWLVNKIVDAMFASEAESKVKREVKILLQAQKVNLTSLEDTKNTNESPQQAQCKTAPSVHKIFDVVQKVTSKAGNSDSSLANFSSPFFPLVLICSPVSQEGVDMHKYCCTIVLHDLNWNPAILEQRIGRLDRVGSFASELKLPVDVFVPFLADSYDEYQYHRVLQRAELQELLFGRNDKNICDKELNDTNDEHNVESKDADVPLLGNLIYGLFDMDLSAESRSDKK